MNIQIYPPTTGDDSPSVTIELSSADVLKKADYDKKYRAAHREKRRAYNKDPERVKRWNALRRDHYKATRAKPRVKKSPEEVLGLKRACWRRYRAKRMASPEGRMLASVRSMVGRLIKKETKVGRRMELLGCNRDELIAHIESQFKTGMTWENYGRFGWHIDHVLPCSSFDLSKPDHQRQCFHYTNLQPLWYLDNLRKGARVFPLAKRGQPEINARHGDTILQES